MRELLVVMVLLATCSGSAFAQEDAALPDAAVAATKSVAKRVDSLPPPPDQFEGMVAGGNNEHVDALVKNILRDQEAIWTSPSRVRWQDADWLVPLGGVLGGLLVSDSQVARHLSNSRSRLNTYRTVSDFGLASLASAAGGLYLWGQATHDEHKRETGWLATEAAVNSLAVTFAAKYAFGRERPLQDKFRGRFWQGGDSFPSEHASASWAIASVIAHEYPGPLTKFLAYGLASTVSTSRIRAKEHFPSDVLVGGTLGWLVGEEVYRHHHHADLGGDDWQTFPEPRAEIRGREIPKTGSPFVELDSWIYPAIERLAALGYVRSAFLDMRPWTRMECAQFIEEAGEQIHVGEPDSDEAETLYTALAREFGGSPEEMPGNSERSLQLESVYTRMTGIDGPPLHDSYHFGQTITNDYGRPFEEGFNTYGGFSGYGTAGRFTMYVRGEYQHAPSAPAYSSAVQQAIAAMDRNPVQPATPFASVDQFRLLDTYIGSNVGGWDFSFGKQSLWWGPEYGGALLFSDNAEPIYMFRASRIVSFQIPLLSQLLGPAKVDAFFGKLSGNEFPPRPVIHGEKISFKPTENLEIGFSRTAELGGVGRALTLGAIWNSYTGRTSSVNYSNSRNPGKRAGGVDFTYKVPFVRNWLTVYADFYSPDDPSPLAGPRRAVGLPGLYMPRIPEVPKLDFRFEAVYTNTPARDNPPPAGGLYAYWDFYYHDYYTNKGNILGSWIGRDGQGFQAWTTYHFSPRDDVQFGYRHAKVDASFVPRGETVNDGSVRVNWSVGKSWTVSSFLRYEKWVAPILAPTAQTNWTASVQVEFWPRTWLR